MKDKSLELLKKYNRSESLIMHGKSVKGVMEHFASLKGQDPEFWGLVGLLHDLDYEMFPEQHCVKSAEILRDNGYSENFIRAVVSHGWGICSEIEPEHVMEKVLYATDELTGLITACAYMRPSKSVMDLEVNSVKKKFKSQSFASGVNRKVILKGCEMLGISLDELIQETIAGLRKIAKEINL